MKKLLLTGILFLMPAVMAQNINGEYHPPFYTFERYDSTNVSETYIRNFESVYLNVSQNKFSLKTRVNFETNLSNSLDNDPRLRFYNLYAEFRDIADIATIKLGRQSLFNSVAGGLYDGVNLQFRYNIFKLKGFTEETFRHIKNWKLPTIGAMITSWVVNLQLILSII